MQRELSFLDRLRVQHQNHLYEQQRLFAKSNGYQGDIRALKQRGYYHELPQIFLTSVPNTSIACTACRGNGVINVVHEGGNVILETCGMCNGTRHIMSAENNDRTDWKTWNQMQLRHRHNMGENILK